MRPRDILNVADGLISGTNEADWRSAVSRAYYAVFHVARHLFQGCGFLVPQADQAHAYLWLRLANSGHPDVQLAGRNLTYLRQIRNWADYDLDRPLDHATALGWVQMAEDVFQLLESAAAEPVIRTRITDAIKIYERDVLRQVTWQP
jgi:uncharacterized protein (UPF0332 family)